MSNTLIMVVLVLEICCIVGIVPLSTRGWELLSLVQIGILDRSFMAAMSNEITEEDFLLVMIDYLYA